MLKILIADDSDIVRRLLRAVLTEVKGWSICGEAINGEQAVLMAQELKPDLIVLDLAMPLLDGLHAATEIRKFAPSLAIVLYTLHKSSEIELEAKKAGIRAVVSKQQDSKVLLETLGGLVAELAETSPIAAMTETLFTALPSPPPGEPQAIGARSSELALAAEAAARGSASVRAAASETTRSCAVASSGSPSDAVVPSSADAPPPTPAASSDGSGAPSHTEVAGKDSKG
jgi:DNA-binding NarL/FixJ family response regulator